MAEQHRHEHPHPPPRPDDPEPTTPHQILGVALSELLIEQGVYSAEDERRMIERIEQTTPALGAKLVARAWVDPAFKARLMQDGNAAAAEFGVPPAPTHLTVVENTPAVHNVVVCTLCSCYPRPILGRPPAWYKSAPYRARTVREPRTVLREFGTVIADDREVRVHDSTAELRYLVLPLRPAGTEGWDEERLAALVSRDAMIGVAEVTPPA